MTIELAGVTVTGGGKEAQVKIVLREGDMADARQFTMPYVIFEGMGLSEGEITREDVNEIIDADERYKAIKRAFEIVGYGRTSAKALAQKLVKRGFRPQVARDIAKYMLDNGYIAEDEDAKRVVDLCVKKLWGGRRILMHLHEKGYEREAIDAAREYMDTLDFVGVCVELIRSKFKTLPKDELQRQKIISALIRHGFSMSEIKAAAKIVEYYRLPGDI